MRKLLLAYLGGSKVVGRLLTVSVVLLLVSLVGLFAARALPAEVEQETTLLNYEHEGRFDYLIHLKPSYLFGPPPEEPPPNPTFPAEIVDTIDFTFEYSPAQSASEVAWIDAVLENPGIWHKKIKLVPYTGTNGDFTLRFSLDIEEIHELFDDIEEEINISSSPRNLTLKAYVAAPEERFVHSLPIQLSKTLIEVDANLRHTQSCGVGQFDYVVNLKKNSIFETETLEPPPVPVVSSSKTLKPGEVVFTKLIDKMDVTFYYRFTADRAVNKVRTDVEIIAFLEATELWSKKFPLLYQRKSGNFKIDFPVNLVDYMELLETIRAETGASAESNNLTITADVHTIAETQFGLIDETFSQPMKGILKGNVLEWDKELTKTEPGSIKEATLIPNPNEYGGLSISGARNLSTALVSVFSILFLFSLVLYIRFKPAELAPVEREALRVGKKYRERMAEATSQEGGKIVSLDSVEDLIKVADELGKPVIHQIPSTTEERHAYYVFDGATQYQYLLTLCREEQATEAGEPEYRKVARKLIEEEVRKIREKDTGAEDGHFQT